MKGQTLESSTDEGHITRPSLAASLARPTHIGAPSRGRPSGSVCGAVFQRRPPPWRWPGDAGCGLGKPTPHGGRDAMRSEATQRKRWWKVGEGVRASNVP